MKIKTKFDALKSIKILPVILLIFVTVFIFQSCSNENNAEVEIETTDLRESDQGVPHELYCEFVCLRGGLKISVWKNDLDHFKYTFVPINTIFVNQDFHTTNPTAQFPYPYTYMSYLGVFSASPYPTLDGFGNPLIGPGYQYGYVGSNVLNRCNASYSTSFYHLQGNDPCDLNIALYYLNNTPNKPDGCELNCPSGGYATGDYVIPNYDPVPSPTVLTNKYGKLCQVDVPGFCYIDINDPPINEPIEDPNIAPGIFSYVNENSIKIMFYKEVGVPFLKVTEEDNRLDSKVLASFGLPPNTTIKIGAYPIIFEDTDNEFGYAILNLDLE